ncbi:Rrf2 family transcriptional regulator [Ideonella azotifigens]|uniref:Fe-S cluster assembly transcriptional regulator IscR n=1 Tax=Ideonella azotifigens TaxID=513160 RepID=A0ABN1JVI2_9BURK|nr:Rrf2 family transcriptional regulator [Ideonella azotifigens]MCD2343300.1 Rrf2 family transcriptional regulator [Ideonella azotifigens]
MQRCLSGSASRAVAAMIELTLSSRGGPVPLHRLQPQPASSKSYLDLLFGKLRRAGLVRSLRGRDGGYVLARPAGTISVADIVRAVEPPTAAPFLDEEDRTGTVPGGAGSRPASPMEACTQALWEAFNTQSMAWLSDLTLLALVDAQRAAMQARQHEAGAGTGLAGASLLGGTGGPRPPRLPRGPNSVFALANACL